MTLDFILNALQNSGLLKTLGIELELYDGGVRAYLTIQPQHAGAPGVAHGGVVMALLDSALGAHAFSRALAVGCATSTVEMKTNFLRPVRIGQRLVVQPEVQSQGKSLLVLSGVAEDADTGERVAFGIGTFNIFETEHLRHAKRPQADAQP